jgi:hypothetical protein
VCGTSLATQDNVAETGVDEDGNTLDCDIPLSFVFIVESFMTSPLACSARGNVVTA